MGTTIANITLGAGGETANVWLAVGTAAAANIVALVVVALQVRSSFSLLKAQRKIDVHERRLTEFLRAATIIAQSQWRDFQPGWPARVPEGRRCKASSRSIVLENRKKQSPEQQPSY